MSSVEVNLQCFNIQVEKIYINSEENDFFSYLYSFLPFLYLFLTLFPLEVLKAALK